MSVVRRVAGVDSLFGSCLSTYQSVTNLCSSKAWTERSTPISISAARRQDKSARHPQSLGQILPELHFSSRRRLSTPLAMQVNEPLPTQATATSSALRQNSATLYTSMLSSPKKPSTSTVSTNRAIAVPLPFSRPARPSVKRPAPSSTSLTHFAPSFDFSPKALLRGDLSCLPFVPKRLQGLVAL